MTWRRSASSRGFDCGRACELGHGGGGYGKLGNRAQYSSAIPEQDTKVLEILVREVRQDRKIDPIFDKAVRVLR